MNYVSVGAAARRFGIPDSSLRSMVRRGKVQTHHIPGHRFPMILETDLDRIEKRLPVIRESIHDPRVLSLRDASQLAGVSEPTVIRLVRSGKVPRCKVPMKGIYIHERYLTILTAAKDDLLPNDPTLDEIRQRAAQARATRSATSPHELMRRQVLRLLNRNGGLTAVVVAGKLGCCTSTALDRLNELEAIGLAESVGWRHRRFFPVGQLGDFAGMQPADTILARFRKQAIKQTRKRSRRLAIAG